MSFRGWLLGVGVAFALFFSPALAGAQGLPTPGDNLEISLVTYGPGEIYWERFGHNAIVVRDLSTGRAVSYNYGMFDFEQDDFFVNFLRGRMMYQIGAFDFDQEYPLYIDEGRSVEQQVLDLTPARKLELAEFLANNAKPENASYRYDYFVSNCSTKLRDALDKALDGAIRKQTEGRSRGYTFRLDSLRLTAPDRWLMLVIDLGLGPYADQRLDFWRESFVPMTLASVVSTTTLPDGRPLVSSRRTLAESRVVEAPALPPDLRPWFAVLGLAITIGLTALHSTRRNVFSRVAFASSATVLSLFFGLGGLVLIGLWGFTEHQSAWRNENLLLLNPLCLLLLPTWIGAFRRGWKVSPRAQVLAWIILFCAAVGLFLKVLPSFVQANLHWILLILPIHLALARAARLSSAPAPAA
ncbi:MAG: DUF4105 domain-containing protein [Dokdonella sp.]